MKGLRIVEMKYSIVVKEGLLVTKKQSLIMRSSKKVIFLQYVFLMKISFTVVDSLRQRNFLKLLKSLGRKALHKSGLSCSLEGANIQACEIPSLRNSYLFGCIRARNIVKYCYLAFLGELNTLNSDL